MQAANLGQTFLRDLVRGVRQHIADAVLLMHAVHAHFLGPLQSFLARAEAEPDGEEGLALHAKLPVLDVQALRLGRGVGLHHLLVSGDGFEHGAGRDAVAAGHAEMVVLETLAGGHGYGLPHLVAIGKGVVEHIDEAAAVEPSLLVDLDAVHDHLLLLAVKVRARIALGFAPGTDHVVGADAVLGVPDWLSAVSVGVHQPPDGDATRNEGPLQRYAVGVDVHDVEEVFAATRVDALGEVRPVRHAAGDGDGVGIGRLDTRVGQLQHLGVELAALQHGHVLALGSEDVGEGHVHLVPELPVADLWVALG